MSLFSKGINMEANSSCAKNIPIQKTPKCRRQSEAGFTDPAEENTSLLLSLLHFITFSAFVQTLDNLCSTSKSSFFHLEQSSWVKDEPWNVDSAFANAVTANRFFFLLFFLSCFQKLKVIFPPHFCNRSSICNKESREKVLVNGHEKKGETDVGDTRNICVSLLPPGFWTERESDIRAGLVFFWRKRRD